MRIGRPLNPLRLASVLATAQLLLAAVILGRHGAPGALGGDFIAYYGAGRQALAGGWQHIYALPAQLAYQQPLLRSSGLAAGGPAMIPFDYPPPAALLFLPLAALPAGAATLLWLALNAAMALVAGRVISRPDGPPLLAVFLLFPLDWGLLSGQPVGIILLLAALSFRSLLRRQDVQAGIWLGAIAIFKPQLLVVPLLGLLVLRRPRAVLGTTLAGAALLATSLVLVGVQGLLAYVQLLRRIDPALGNAAFSVRTGAMINWRAWITAIPGIDARAALTLTAAAAVVTVAAALIGGRRRVGEAGFDWRYLGLNAAGLLAGYHSHYQDLVMLLPPAVMLLAGWMQAPGHGNSPVNADQIPLGGAHPALAGRDHPPINGRREGAAGRSGQPTKPPLALLLDLAVPLTALLLVAAPGLAWLIFGLFALSWLPIWTALAAPALLLLLVAGWRQREGVLVSTALPTAHDLSVVVRGTAAPEAALAAAIPAAGKR